MNISMINRIVSEALWVDWCFWFAMVLLVTALNVSPSLAQSKDTTAKAVSPQVFKDWKLQCEAETKRCYIFQRTDVQETGQRVLNVVIGNLGPDGKQVLHFTVPLGIYIPAGIAMKIDEDEQMTIPVHTCMPAGCEGMLNLEAKTLAALESAKGVNIAFLDAVTRNQITVGVSVSGFRDAYTALRRALSLQ